MGTSHTILNPDPQVEAGLELDTDDGQLFSLGIGKWSSGPAKAIGFNVEINNLDRDDLQRIIFRLAGVFASYATAEEKIELKNSLDGVL